MAAITNTVIYDGQIYHAGQELPDLGSLVAVEVDGLIRSYRGMSEDEAKLPTYVGEGSTCIMADTGDMYIFSDGTWNKTFTEE